MGAVFRKEFRSSMRGVAAPLFIAIVFGVVNVFFWLNNFRSDGYGSAHVEYALISAVFWSLLFVPLLTMRLFSEERHNKTDQLLYSLPITGTQVVLGKYFAACTIFAIPCAAFCFYPLLLEALTDAEIPYLMCYIGIGTYFLAGCAVIAICMFMSTLFESQIITALTSLAVIIGLYILGNVTSSLTGFWGAVAGAVSIFSRIYGIGYGYPDWTCALYYLSAAALFVFFTVQSFERRRWS